MISVPLFGLDGSGKSLLCRMLCGTINANGQNQDFLSTSAPLLLRSQQKQSSTVDIHQQLPYVEYQCSAQELKSRLIAGSASWKTENMDRNKNDQSKFSPTNATPAEIDDDDGDQQQQQQPHHRPHMQNPLETPKNLLIDGVENSTATPATSLPNFVCEQQGRNNPPEVSNRNELDHQHIEISSKTPDAISFPFESINFLDTSGSSLLRGAWVPLMLETINKNRSTSSSPIIESRMIFVIDSADLRRAAFAWTELMQVTKKILLATAGNKNCTVNLKVCVVLFVTDYNQQEEGGNKKRPLSLNAKSFEKVVVNEKFGGVANSFDHDERVLISFVDVVPCVKGSEENGTNAEFIKWFM